MYAVSEVSVGKRERTARRPWSRTSAASYVPPDAPISILNPAPSPHWTEFLASLAQKHHFGMELYVAELAFAAYSERAVRELTASQNWASARYAF